MKGRPKITVVIFLVTVGFTEGLTWNTKMRAAVCCQGNKQLLIWNFTEGENESVTELHWFFNEETLVCFVSNSTGFLVAEFYEGRVERNGTAGILLKNVSLNDAGEYTLYVKLKVEKERNIQGINLTVVEPPPNQCKPIIKNEHPKGIISCSTSCERSPLSLEWIINGTMDPGGIGPYFVVNSSGASEQPICCLRDFKCLDDYQTKFCTRNNISFTEDVHTVNESVADTNHMVCTPIMIILIVIPMVLINVVIACVTLNRRRCWSFHRDHSTRTQDMKLHGDLLMQTSSEETVLMRSKDQEPHADVNYVQAPEETVLMCSNDQEPHADVNDVQVPAAVEPKHSSTVAQCKEDLQLYHNVAATTDRPLQDSKHRVQIVNNISIDTDCLKSILHSNTALTVELQASRKGTRKLKKHLHRKIHLRKKDEMPRVKRSDFKKSDTDTSETFEWDDAFSDYTDSSETSESEDAFSETREPKRILHRKKYLRKKENRDRYSLEKTQVKCSDFKSSDTDTSEISKWEDALPELLVHHNYSEGVSSC